MKNEQENREEKISRNRKLKKWLFISLGVAATGALTYFGWQYWKSKQTQLQEEADTDAEETKNPSSYVPKPARNDNFPLKKGSKGAHVKTLQQALIAKYGKSILPNYGADGDFGSETAAALKKSGLPESVDESTFLAFTEETPPDFEETAKQLHTAAVNKEFSKVITLLKTLRSTEDYQAVSEVFLTYRVGGVRQTLVNGLLNSFTDEKQKQGIRLAFSAMGLKYDGSKWSLSGLGESTLLITLRPSRVWKDPKTSVPVPAQMVLGKEITQRENYTLFENDSELFLVESKDVKRINK